jgi:hypothetical protein
LNTASGRQLLSDFRETGSNRLKQAAAMKKNRQSKKRIYRPTDNPGVYPRASKSEAAPMRTDGGSLVLVPRDEGSDPLAAGELVDQMDARVGFNLLLANSEPAAANDKNAVNDAGLVSRVGWMVNMQQTLRKSQHWPSGISAVDFYFIQDDGGRFKASLAVEPYFLISCTVRSCCLLSY